MAVGFIGRGSLFFSARHVAQLFVVQHRYVAHRTPDESFSLKAAQDPDCRLYGRSGGLGQHAPRHSRFAIACSIEQCACESVGCGIMSKCPHSLVGLVKPSRNDSQHLDRKLWLVAKEREDGVSRQAPC